MAASFLSSEQLVQSFKQNKLSTEERIDLAFELINNAPGTALPNRDEFLLEWCISQLVRSAKLDDEKSAGAPYLNPKYYELLLRLIPGNMPTHFIKATISRSAFVPVITRMLSYIGANMAIDKGTDLELCSTLVNLALKALVEGAPYMEAISQDWVVKLLLATLSLTKIAGGVMKDYVLDLLAFSLSDLFKYFKWTGMYKKVFSTTIDQLLLPLSRCRYTLNPVCKDNPKAKKVIEVLDGILDLGLFHPNYVIDYANLVSNPTAPFYRKQLFKCLRSYLEETPGAILSLMPILLGMFMEKFTKDIRLKLGFSFSWELVDIVSETLDCESSNQQIRVLCIQTISEVLGSIHHYGVYVPSNNQASQAQLAKLGKAYQLLKSLWGGEVPQAPLLRGFCALVSIDYCLVDSDVCWLWAKVASSKAEDLPSASSLGLALLQQYGFARQLERCFHAMAAALDKITDFKQTILCYESFVTGFHSILEQLGSVSQASHLLGLVIDLVCPSSGSQSSSNHIGSVLILAHFVGGLSSSLIPLPPPNLERAVIELGSNMFSDPLACDLLLELSCLAEELSMPPTTQSKPALKHMAILHLFANIQDKWPKVFISASQIVAWCRKNRANLPRSTSLVASWEHFLIRLLLQHIEIAVREGTLSAESACAYFKLCIRLLEYTDPSVKDGIIHTLLGPYLPFVAELMHSEEKKVLMQTLVTDILEPAGRLTSPSNQIFFNARFFEITSLRKFILGELFDRFIACFPQVSTNQDSLSFVAADQARYNALQSILSTLHMDSACRVVDQSQLDLLQRILLALTHFPHSYFSPTYRAILLLALRVHQELLSSSQDAPTSLQVGWEVNLALVCTIVDSDIILVRQKRNEEAYIFWLLETVTNFLAKLSTQTYLLIDQLTHIITSGLNISLCHTSEEETDLCIFDGLTFSLSISPAMVLKYEILSQVIRKITTNTKLSEKLRLKNLTLFQPATLCGHWQSLEKITYALPSHVPGIELRTSLALTSLYSAAAAVCPDFAWLEAHQSTFSQLLAICHHFFDSATPSSEAAAILEGGIQVHRALVCSFPLGCISEDKLLPTVASFISFCKKLCSLSANASFSDLSTEALLHSASEFLMRLNSQQWNTVLSAIFEHLLSLPDGEHSRATFFSLTLLVGDTTELFRKSLVASLPQIVHNLVQLLILKPGLRKFTLSMIADIVRRPDFHLPSNTLGVLLSHINTLPIGDVECENILGRIMIRIMKGHKAGLSHNLPTLVSALGRISQSQKVDMGMVLQYLPNNKQVPGIQHHIQYLLILLINIQEHIPNDSSVFTGWFHCFDALQSTSLESLLDWLNPTQQHLLKCAHQEYLKHHKFTGKV